MRFQICEFLCRKWVGPLLIAVVAATGILTAIDPVGDFPSAPQGPGLTLDEIINAEQGWRLTAVIPRWIGGDLTLAEAFGEPSDNPRPRPILARQLQYQMPDYPPLGRLWLGISHNLARWAVPPHEDRRAMMTVYARTGSVFAFALTVFLLGMFAARQYGPVAGWAASAATALMPRLFGHAHLASVETVMGLAYAATVISVAVFWSGRQPPSWKAAAGTGVIFGLALLTKMQAILLPAPIVLWAIFRYRQRAIAPLMIWGTVAGVVFFCGWPWLWIDPWNHVWQYFAQTTERITLKVWFLGESYSDSGVPRSYPLVMFLTTVPIGLHLLGVYGLFANRWGKTLRDGNRPESVDGLIVATAFFPLLAFSLPGVTVYDGARLFLVVFPLWAVLIGRGTAVLFRRIADRWSRTKAVWATSAFLALQSVGLFAMHPYYLSYYNALVGGLWGAERVGLEPTYWGDSISRDFLRTVGEKVPQGSTIDVSPVLHGLQLPDLISQSPILRERRIELRGYDPEKNGPALYLMVFRRRADLSPTIDPPPGSETLAEVRRQGVLLAALYRLPR